MSKSRMGGLGKLSDFGGKSTQQQVEPVIVSKVETTEQALKTEISVSKIVQETARKKLETTVKVVTVNIKISRDMHNWLSDTAQSVRDNNNVPMPANERVFPQHLIGVAIELLKKTPIDWTQIKTVEDLKKHLKL
jgi:hypothetical protein